MGRKAIPRQAVNEHEPSRIITGVVTAPGDRDCAECRRLALAARGALQAVFAGWDTSAGGGVERAIEAQIAAAALGYKPLYFDPWDEPTAERIRDELIVRIPSDVRILALPEGLLVFRPATVAPFLDARPEFYRPRGEDDDAALQRAVSTGFSGELLGYGAFNLLTPHAARVTLFSAERVLFTFFVSEPEKAPIFARLRAEDIAAAFDLTVLYEIEF